MSLSPDFVNRKTMMGINKSIIRLIIAFICLIIAFIRLIIVIIKLIITRHEVMRYFVFAAEFTIYRETASEARRLFKLKFGL